MLVDDKGTQAAAKSIYRQKQGHKRALGICATKGCTHKRDGRVYCKPCLNRLSRERERVKARGGMWAVANKQIDGDPHVNSSTLLPGTIIECPMLGCNWKGERRQMWKHEKEHRK